MEFRFIELLVAFAGGIFGAAIGALPVWILCGLAVLIGAAINMATGNPSFTNMVSCGLPFIVFIKTAKTIEKASFY